MRFVAIYIQDPHFYNLFKHNIIRYGTGKLSLGLYNSFAQMMEHLKMHAESEVLVVVQSNEILELPEQIKSIGLGNEDVYDERGLLQEISLGRPFEELIGMIEEETRQTAHFSGRSKTFFAVCDESVSKTSMLQRLSSMANQYERSVLLVDLDLVGEYGIETRVASERAVYQILSEGTVQWSGLCCPTGGRFYYFKPFYKAEDAYLLDPVLLHKLGESASAQGIEFLMAVHRGNLSAPALALGKCFDECFVIGESFERARVREEQLEGDKDICFFTDGYVGSAGDILTAWHKHMNSHMKKVR